MRHRRLARVAFLALIALLYVFLIAPIVIVVVASLNAGRFLVFPPEGLSLQWYVKFMNGGSALRGAPRPAEQRAADAPGGAAPAPGDHDVAGAPDLLLRHRARGDELPRPPHRPCGRVHAVRLPDGGGRALQLRPLAGRGGAQPRGGERHGVSADHASDHQGWCHRRCRLLVHHLVRSVSDLAPAERCRNHHPAHPGLRLPALLLRPDGRGRRHREHPDHARRGHHDRAAGGARVSLRWRPPMTSARRDDRYRIGFDIGGTFTDFVLLDAVSGRIRIHKCLTTPKDPSAGALEGLDELLRAAGLTFPQIGQLIHGTTLVTNAII